LFQCLKKGSSASVNNYKHISILKNFLNYLNLLYMIILEADCTKQKSVGTEVEGGHGPTLGRSTIGWIMIMSLLSLDLS
jgi:hypothetical protein